MKDYKDQVSDIAIAKASVEKFKIVQNQRQFEAGAYHVRSILLPIIEEKEKEAVKAKGELALLLRELKDTDSEQKDAIGFKTWCDELHEQYYDAGIKEEFWRLADSTLAPLDYSDKELYELYLKQKA